MLHLQVDPHSGVPVYRQVMNQIKHYVAAGALETGDRLPSIRALSRTLHVNPTTIVKAYGELQHEGVIELRHGKGAFVATEGEGVAPEDAARMLRPLARQLAIEAHQLGASPELVLRVLAEELGAPESGR